MASRIRWLSVGADAEYHRLSSGLLADVFGPGSSAGFKLTRLDQERIEGTFVERVERLVRFSGPLGEDIQFTSIAFPSVHFTVDMGRRTVELRDQPRSIKSFLARMARHIGEEDAFKELHVPVWRWWQELAHQVDAAEITSVSFDRIPVSASVSGSVELAGSVPKPLVDARVREYGVERMNAVGGTIRTAAGAVRVSLASSANVRSMDALDPLHVDLVRGAMLAVMVDSPAQAHRT